MYMDEVTMDDTTNSVYMSGTRWGWVGFDGKTGNGGRCTGKSLGRMTQGCNKLQKGDSRIRCVSNKDYW